MGIDLAFYRGMDATTGRWMQVDPKAELMFGYNPYHAMGNNPISNIDPLGDEPITAVLIYAAISVTTNGIGNLMQGDSFFKGWGSAAISGALTGNPGGAAVAGITNHLPSYTVSVNDILHLKIRPSISVTNIGSFIGVNISMIFQTPYFSGGISLSGGYSSQTLGDSKASGLASIVGFGGSVGGKKANVGIYTTFFGGAGISQQTAGIKFGSGPFSLTYENDGAPFEKLDKNSSWLQDGDDKFRTNAVSIGYGDLDLRLNMFTGEAGKSIEEEGYPHRVYTGGTADNYRLGALSIGYRGYRAGWNSEGIRHLAQNKFAHGVVKPQPWFRHLGGKGSFFGARITGRNAYSLWWF